MRALAQMERAVGLAGAIGSGTVAAAAGGGGGSGKYFATASAPQRADSGLQSGGNLVP